MWISYLTEILLFSALAVTVNLLVGYAGQVSVAHAAFAGIGGYSVAYAVTELGLPDEFLDHATRAEIMEQVGLTPQAITRDVVAQVLGSRIPVARPLPTEFPASQSVDSERD